ncbi:hypothetical protein CK203_112550 [Vitis vinifera]|uniref:DUF4283 domain-containing protein n=1 Tax=Vitis vinifera TaxID=29760 RepID=A0A438CS92_VITVI|nr:hypothetical protein CK203_112550 [Vitis vinifera]
MMAAFSEGEGAPKGGKCWFAVESKTFEISIEETRGKLRGIILERSKGLSSWIKFGEKSLSSLLEGVEEWCREESSSRSLRAWEEGGRKYRLECRSNAAGRYLLCSVRDSEAKRFCLVFPEGKGLVGGWFMLAQKLRALGITSQPMKKFDLGNSTSVKEDYRGKGKEKGKGVIPDAERVEKGDLGEALWVDVEWAYDSWSLKGGLKISRLGGALVLFEFEDKVDAEWVLLRGSRRLQRREFFLQKWGPEVGCCRNGSHPKDVWVKVVGLPLHLWSREVFKSIGERCGGFIAVDEDTAFFSELQWARILVKAPGKIKQGTLQVIAGKCCWTVSLWWENPPWFSEVVERREASGIQVECGRGQGEAAVAGVDEGRRPSQDRFWAKSPLPASFKKKGWGWASKPTSGMELEVRSSSARASSVPAETEEGLDPELRVFQLKMPSGRRRVDGEAPTRL